MVDFPALIVSADHAWFIPDTQSGLLGDILIIHKVRVLDYDMGSADSLEWLKLGGNQLTSVPHFALRNLSRLRQLDLRGNLISKLDLHSFDTYGKTLKFIFLQKNCIRTIEEGSLDVLESAEWLYLHSNELRELRYDTFKAIIDNLHVLDLHVRTVNPVKS
ncbi:uncharacterized protein CDAR_293511 [Caerostris darwini]|uniref:Uncharacterized protein n=1 Tax=Caerostris darwini TaxID=1538125 RepID=A0AAV4REX8_9ARAC|nr:uncharacterized protein CDAR_293511 [Caerostris darwini]